MSLLIGNYVLPTPSRPFGTVVNGMLVISLERI